MSLGQESVSTSLITPMQQLLPYIVTGPADVFLLCVFGLRTKMVMTIVDAIMITMRTAATAPAIAPVPISVPLSEACS